MFCPKCGVATSEDAVYCRSCGLSLIPIAEMVAGEPLERGSALGIRSREGIGRLGLATFILGLVVALLNAAFSKQFDFPDLYGKTIFLTLIAVGMLVMALSLFLPSYRRTRHKSAPSRTVPEAAVTVRLQPAAAADEARMGLVRDLDPVPSVTDHTTRNLG